MNICNQRLPLFLMSRLTAVFLLTLCVSRLSLADDLTIHGRIYGQNEQCEEKGPVAGARVEFLNNAGSMIGSATTSEDGAFLIPNVPTGIVKYRITATGYEQHDEHGKEAHADDLPGLELNAENSGKLQDLVICRTIAEKPLATGDLTVRVRETTDEGSSMEVAEVTVSVKHSKTDQILETKRDAGGDFTAKLPEGEWEVTANVPGRPPVKYPALITVEPNGTAKCTITLSSDSYETGPNNVKAHISVQVTKKPSTGTPVVSFVRAATGIEAVSSSVPGVLRPLDADELATAQIGTDSVTVGGWKRFIATPQQPLSDGDYRAEVSLDGFTPDSQLKTVDGALPTDFDLALRSKGSPAIENPPRLPRPHYGGSPPPKTSPKSQLGFTGRVYGLDKDCKPLGEVVGAKIEFLDKNKRVVASTVSKKHGWYEIYPLQPGKYFFRVNAKGYSEDPGDYSFKELADHMVTKDLQVKKGASDSTSAQSGVRISVFKKKPDGDQRMTDVTVVVYSGKNEKTLVVDPISGDFEASVEPGTWWATALLTSDTSPEPVALEVKPGQTIPWKFVIEDVAESKDVSILVAVLRTEGTGNAKDVPVVRLSNAANPKVSFATNIQPISAAERAVIGLDANSTDERWEYFWAYPEKPVPTGSYHAVANLNGYPEAISQPSDKVTPDLSTTFHVTLRPTTAPREPTPQKFGQLAGFIRENTDGVVRKFTGTGRVRLWNRDTGKTIEVAITKEAEYRTRIPPGTWWTSVRAPHRYKTVPAPLIKIEPGENVHRDLTLKLTVPPADVIAWVGVMRNGVNNDLPAVSFVRVPGPTNGTDISGKAGQAADLWEMELFRNSQGQERLRNLRKIDDGDRVPDWVSNAMSPGGPKTLGDPHSNESQQSARRVMQLFNQQSGGGFRLSRVLFTKSQAVDGKSNWFLVEVEPESKAGARAVPGVVRSAHLPDLSVLTRGLDAAPKEVSETMLQPAVDLNLDEPITTEVQWDWYIARPARPLAPGWFKVEATLGGYDPAESKVKAVGPGQTTKYRLYLMPRPTAIPQVFQLTGTITSETSQQPIEGAKVVLRQVESRMPQSQTRPTANGQYRSPITRGFWYAEALAPGHSSSGEMIWIFGDRNQTHHFVLKPQQDSDLPASDVRATIEVVDFDGTGVPQAQFVSGGQSIPASVTPLRHRPTVDNTRWFVGVPSKPLPVNVKWRIKAGGLEGYREKFSSLQSIAPSEKPFHVTLRRDRDNSPHPGWLAGCIQGADCCAPFATIGELSCGGGGFGLGGGMFFVGTNQQRQAPNSSDLMMPPVVTPSPDIDLPDPNAKLVDPIRVPELKPIPDDLGLQAGRNPITGAVVTLRHVRTGQTVVVRTENGSFLTELPSGEWLCSVTADGYKPFQLPQQITIPEVATENISVVMAPPPSPAAKQVEAFIAVQKVPGRNGESPAVVFDANSESTFAATVQRPSPDQLNRLPLDRQPMTEWDWYVGRPTEPLPSGRSYRVVASVDGFQPQDKSADVARPVTHQTPTAFYVTLDMVRPQADVVVMDSNDQPIAGADIRFINSDLGKGFADATKVTTTADGKANARLEDGIGNYKVWLSGAEGFEPQLVPAEHFPRDRPLVIQLHREGEVRMTSLTGLVQGGEIKSQDVKPVAEAVIHMQPTGNAAIPVAMQQPVHTGSDGQWQRDEVPEGEYFVVMEAPGFKPWEGQLSVTTDMQPHRVILEPRNSVLESALCQLLSEGWGRTQQAKDAVARYSQEALKADPKYCGVDYAMVLIHRNNNYPTSEQTSLDTGIAKADGSFVWDRLCEAQICRVMDKKKTNQALGKLQTLASEYFNREASQASTHTTYVMGIAFGVLQGPWKENVNMRSLAGIQDRILNGLSGPHHSAFLRGRDEVLSDSQDLQERLVEADQKNAVADAEKKQKELQDIAKRVAEIQKQMKEMEDRNNQLLAEQKAVCDVVHRNIEKLRPTYQKFETSHTGLVNTYQATLTQLNTVRSQINIQAMPQPNFPQGGGGGQGGGFGIGGGSIGENDPNGGGGGAGGFGGIGGGGGALKDSLNDYGGGQSRRRLDSYGGAGSGEEMEGGGIGGGGGGGNGGGYGGVEGFFLSVPDDGTDRPAMTGVGGVVRIAMLAAPAPVQSNLREQERVLTTRILTIQRQIAQAESEMKKLNVKYNQEMAKCKAKVDAQQRYFQSVNQRYSSLERQLKGLGVRETKRLNSGPEQTKEMKKLDRALQTFDTFYRFPVDVRRSEFQKSIDCGAPQG